MEQPTPNPPPVPPKQQEPVNPNFRPSNTLLVVMGILVLLGGIGYLLNGVYTIFYPAIFPLMIASDPSISGGELEFLEKFSGSGLMLMFISLGVSMLVSGGLISWLGIGSIMITKWAPKLLHAMGWLIIGTAVWTLIFFLMLIPIVAAVPEAINSTVMASSGTSMGSSEMSFVWGMLAVYTVIGVASTALPGAILVIFYGRKNVELTTHYRNPKPSWTDKLNFKVLVVWLLFVSTLIFVPYLFPLIHMFAKFNLISNPMLSYIALAISTLLAIIAVIGITKLTSWSWWACLAYFVVSLAMSFLFFNSIEVDLPKIVTDFGGAELLEEAKESTDIQTGLDLAEFGINKFLRSSYLSGLLILVSCIGYLIYVKKDFSHQPEPKPV